MDKLKFIVPTKANSFPNTQTQLQFIKEAIEEVSTQEIPDIAEIRDGAAKGKTAYQKPSSGIPPTDLSEAVNQTLNKANSALQVTGTPATGKIPQINNNGDVEWITPSAGTTPDSTMSESSTNAVQNKVITEEIGNINNAINTLRDGLLGGDIIPAKAETLEPWADQKAIATPDTYTDAVRTTGGDIPIETSAGSKIESIRPVAGSKWTAKMLFNGSYNMLNAAKWGASNSQPYVGGVGSDFVYFLVPELTLGTFGTADDNNGLLFTDSEGENVQPTSVYFKPLGATVPQSLTDGTSVSPTSVSYDSKTYKDYETSGAGWLIIPKSYYDNDICAHIAWEDWYDKYVSLDEPTTNPEAVVGVLILEGLLALAHSDKYLRGVNDGVFDSVIFSDTSAFISHMVDEVSVAAASWTNAATGESDSQGNALYRHSATVSGIKNGGAACVEGEDGGIPLTVNGTTVSYIDTNATAPASVVFYEVTATSTTKAYTDSVFSGSNIDTDTGVLPINDCSIEAQVAMDGEANITVKYAKNIVDQVAINATVDVPQIKHEVEEHEERITELEDTAVRTGSYDASVAVGLADNFKGDTIIDAEFYKRKTGDTQSVGSGIAAIKEMRGKSSVWNQLWTNPNCVDGEGGWRSDGTTNTYVNNTFNIELISSANSITLIKNLKVAANHKLYVRFWMKSSIALTKVRISLQGNSGTAENIINDARVSTIDTWNQYSAIIYYSGNVTFMNIDCNKSGMVAGDNVTFAKGFFTDLTLMFGAGNEPTVAEFEKMFPLDYYNYNAGEVIPFAGQNLVTIGFNQWDEQWEVGTINSNGNPTLDGDKIRSKNFIPVIAGQQYYVGENLPSDGFYCYDANKVFVGKATKNANVCTIPNNASYAKFRVVVGYGNTYKNDICINISNPDRNGTYEPYEKHTLPLDPSQWRDKNGNLVFPYGGMHGVGTAYDYAKVDADGYIRKAVRCFEQVDDLGSLNWKKSAYEYFYAPLPYLSKDNGSLITIGYSNTSWEDKSIWLSNSSNYNVIAMDNSYADAASLKAAMQGVPLIYELAEPVEVELATPVYAKYLVDEDGTEEITPANGSTPYTTMANLSILYAMDARGTIANLPKNYLSKESAENMLNAMVSAGVIASYTMTWDAANSRYAFVITAPVESEPTPEPEETND